MEVFDIWQVAARDVANSLYWKDSRDDDEIILKQVGEIERIIGELISNPPSEEELRRKIEEIF
jgi:hypothetical protein